MFLIGAIKPKAEKKFKTFFILSDCLGLGSLESTKEKPVLFGNFFML